MQRLIVLRAAFFSTDPKKRLDAGYRLGKMLADRYGFHVVYPDMIWRDELKPLTAQWMEITRSTEQLYESHYILHSMARAVSNLLGDTAECGVHRGRGSFVICLANQGKASYEHHGFDSFEGLSQPETADMPTSNLTAPWKEHDLTSPLETASANLSRFPFARLYQGWIPARFGEVADRQFSFVHIDVDLYQPTRDSLIFFYERLVPGGILICDDYGAIISPGSKKAFDEFIADKPEQSVIQLTTGQGFIVKR